MTQQLKCSPLRSSSSSGSLDREHLSAAAFTFNHRFSNASGLELDGAVTRICFDPNRFLVPLAVRLGSLKVNPCPNLLQPEHPFLARFDLWHTLSILQMVDRAVLRKMSKMWNIVLLSNSAIIISTASSLLITAYSFTKCEEAFPLRWNAFI